MLLRNHRRVPQKRRNARESTGRRAADEPVGSAMLHEHRRPHRATRHGTESRSPQLVATDSFEPARSEVAASADSSACGAGRAAIATAAAPSAPMAAKA
ncbi:hypothetical protein SAMN04487905_110121 [Actinopolyspora xinjiangensis]|uniref:Uncharacterized protein n=1 Tax=Actinopolyspora xinjiangensis TaxID=405564 RepID=A0A1H0W1D8_9ACTN|nr:hypothetical protein SAMN04487905_110121 [Actinopolyspora xinjiangensis]